MKNKCPIIITTVAMFITSCGNKVNDPLKDWRYTKSEAGEFIDIINTSVGKIDENTLEFECIAEENTYIDNISEKDILLYECKKADELAKEEEYYTIDVLKASEAEYESFKYEEETNKIHIEIKNDQLTNYGILINKRVVKDNKFAIGISKTSLGMFDKIQTEFEEEYIKAEPSWASAKAFINVAGSIALIIAALGTTPVPATSVVTGLFSYMTNFGDMFANQGPSLQDVMNKLESIDNKLDMITEQIQQNQMELMDELVKIETQIDEVQIQQYEQNIVAYNTDYIEQLDTEINVYANYVNNQLKEQTKQDQNIDIYYKDNEGKKELQYKTSIAFDEVGLEKYSYPITWTNTREYLKDHNNIVGEGFGTSFMDDIKESIKDEEKPQSISADQVAEDIYATILDEIQAYRYRNVISQDDIVRFCSKVTNMAKRIKGTVGNSIVTSYVNRIKEMYNFAGEAKSVLRSTLTNIKYNLDRFIIQANSACYYAGINATEMGEAYEAALDTIQSTWESINELDDRYSFVMGIEIEGGLYRSIFDISYTNIGNYPTFHSKLHTSHVVGFNGCTTTLEDADLNNFTYISSNDNKRMGARYRVLKSMGISKANNYLEYLVEAKVIDSSTYKTYKDMDEKGWFGKEVTRILTGWSIRDLNEDDSNLYLACTAKGGKSGSDYFNVGWRGYYRNEDNSREAKYWSGQIVEGTFIDALTGQPIAKKQTIAAYAEYNESHTLWVNDEHWGFIDNVYGNYYFILNAVTK